MVVDESLGQVTGVTSDRAGNLYLIHRGTGNFMSRGLLDFDPIVKLGLRGEYTAAFGRKLFNQLVVNYDLIRS